MSIGKCPHCKEPIDEIFYKKVSVQGEFEYSSPVTFLILNCLECDTILHTEIDKTDLLASIKNEISNVELNTNDIDSRLDNIVSGVKRINQKM